MRISPDYPLLHVQQRLTVASLRGMSRDVFCVAPDVSLEALTTALLERGLDAVLVIDRVGRIVGVVPGDGTEDTIVP